MVLRPQLRTTSVRRGDAVDLEGVQVEGGPHGLEAGAAQLRIRTLPPVPLSGSDK